MLTPIADRTKLPSACLFRLPLLRDVPKRRRTWVSRLGGFVAPKAWRARGRVDGLWLSCSMCFCGFSRTLVNSRAGGAEWWFVRYSW